MTVDKIQEELSYYLDAKWKQFGVHLGVDFLKLNGIESDNSYKAGPCMTDLLGKWMIKEKGTGKKPRTWQTVARAVGCSGLPELAKDIAKKYNVQIQT